MTKPLRKAVEIICLNLNSKKVLEIGSRQAENQKNLANLRSLFPTANYLGTDMIDGPGVDRVVDAEKLPFGKGSFDLVLCLETFEHTRKPWLIAAEIERVVSDNGVIIISSQQNFPLHKHPSDYFRYTPYGLSSFFDNFKSRLVFSISPPFDDEVKLNPEHVILVGSKMKNMKLLATIKRKLTKNKNIISVHKPYRHRLFDLVKFFRRGLAEIQYRQEIEFF
ncbi:class I SAM-dependent methyltransferase [Candidatus Curtissbacteria bacterium]|nr:class I SAM-dependent methyltransferase [Candidatus Curtissbacteria bacterium]